MASTRQVLENPSADVRAQAEEAGGLGACHPHTRHLAELASNAAQKPDSALIVPRVRLLQETESRPCRHEGAHPFRCPRSAPLGSAGAVGGRGGRRTGHHRRALSEEAVCDQVRATDMPRPTTGVGRSHHASTPCRCRLVRPKHEPIRSPASAKEFPATRNCPRPARQPFRRVRHERAHRLGRTRARGVSPSGPGSGRNGPPAPQRSPARDAAPHHGRACP